MIQPKQAFDISMALILGGFVVWLTFKMRHIVDNITVETPCRPPTKKILKDKQAVSKELCRLIVQMARFEIDAKGWFIFAVAGGSVLDLLTGLVEWKDAVDWSRVTLAFVNHKCIPLDHPKASAAIVKKNFCNDLNLTDIILPFVTLTSPTTDGSIEAKEYQKQLVQTRLLPVTYDNMPIFDLILLGLGVDGHVGSNHPNSVAVLSLHSAVVPSPKEGEPSSITLSIPAINAAKNKILVVTGGKDGKKAVKRAMIRPFEGERGSFPAQLLDRPLFLLDEEAAAELSF